MLVEPASSALDYLETFVLGAVDTSLAAQNAVVALESLGPGSVYIGGIRNQPAAVAAELDLPPRLFPLFGLVVGKSELAGDRTRRPEAMAGCHGLRSVLAELGVELR